MGEIQTRFNAESGEQIEIFDLEYLVLAAEAVLFANGSAVTFDKIASAIETEEDKIPEILAELKKRYDARETPIELVIMKDCAVLATKSRFRDIVRRALEQRKNQPLSKAALEVLAVIAYHQPVTRAFIDKVRGVESPSVVANLAEKGLIEEKGRLDAPGRPVLYGTTPVFLRTFGLASVEDLQPPVIEGEFSDGIEDRIAEDGKSMASVVGSTVDFLADMEYAEKRAARVEAELAAHKESLAGQADQEDYVGEEFLTDADMGISEEMTDDSEGDEN